MPNLANLVHTYLFYRSEMMKSRHPSLPSYNLFVIVFYLLFRRLAKRDAAEAGVGSAIWDRINKGVAAVGNFPPKLTIGIAGGIRHEDFGSFKNLILEETRNSAAKALGKYYGNLLYQSFI